MAAPLILGHRGAPREGPENTLRAFRRAMEHGADGIELDVQLSADGVPVVIHDDTLDRTTDGRGPVAALPWAALAAVRAEGEPLPRLDEVMAWAAEAGAFVNVEIKAPGAEAAAAGAVRRAGMMERTLFSSFHPGTVRRVGEIAPEARRYLLSETWDAAVREAVRDTGSGGMCLHDPAVTDGVLAELRALSLPVVVWTVDDAARIRALLDAGVEAVITNRPDTGVRVRAAVSRMGDPPSAG
jgi:glycerophosphoryl diester phosphodiesterase